MTDPKDGEWYEASDGKWYQWPDPTPHDARPTAPPPPPPPPPPPAPSSSAWAAPVAHEQTPVVATEKKRKKWPWIAAAVVGVMVVAGALAPAEEKDKDKASSSSTASSSPSPSSSPSAVESIAASPTPSPTPPPPPSPAAKPTRYAGRGDDVVKVKKPEDGPVLMYVKANAGSRYFGITTLGAGNEELEQPVNTTDVYEGITLLDADGSETTAVKIQAVGSWVIELRPLSAARKFPATISGKGDDVVLYASTESGIASIKGNAGGRYFGVAAYTASGDNEQLVNTTEPYNGKVPMPEGPALVVFTAVGAWSMTVT